MTRKELIAEILTETKKFDDLGLVDYKSLNRWIANELKMFGNNIMQITEKVLRVENGRVELPENFFSLYSNVIIRCKPSSYKFEKGCVDDLFPSHFWRQKLETTYEWDNWSDSYTGKDFKLVEEKVVLKDVILKVRFNDFQILRKSKSIKKDLIADNYSNLNSIRNNWEYMLFGNYINLNFNDDFIYIQYYALPTDDEGDLEIPDSRYLQEYLITYCKRKIIENAWTGDDEKNLIQKLQYFKQEEDKLKGLAKTEVKFNALSKDWWKKIRRNNIEFQNKYENMFKI